MTYKSHFLKYLGRWLGVKPHHGPWNSLLLHPANQKDAGTSKENYEEFRHQNVQPENPCSALIQTLQSLINCL